MRRVPRRSEDKIENRHNNTLTSSKALYHSKTSLFAVCGLMFVLRCHADCEHAMYYKLDECRLTIDNRDKQSLQLHQSLKSLNGQSVAVCGLIPKLRCHADCKHCSRDEKNNHFNFMKAFHPVNDQSIRGLRADIRVEVPRRSRTCKVYF